MKSLHGTERASRAGTEKFRTRCPEGAGGQAGEAL